MLDEGYLRGRIRTAEYMGEQLLAGGVKIIQPVAPVSGLYLHVPFCLHKCGYCDFYSVVPDVDLVEKYLASVEDELIEAASGGHLQKIKTVFFGGGNPTSIGFSALDKLVQTTKDKLGHNDILEWTIESNPETLSSEMVLMFREIPGFRLSMGVQRLSDAELAILGRRASCDGVVRALEQAVAMLPSVGMDLILGVPGCPSIASELDRFLDCHPLDHVSAYFLTPEPGTALWRRIAAREAGNPDDIDPSELYEVAQVLSAKGYEWYEISNFARPGRRCLHNMNYWLKGNYLGIGPSAVGTIGAERVANPRSLSFRSEERLKETLSPGELFDEYVMLRLRLLHDGLVPSELERFCGAVPEWFTDNLERALDEGGLIIRSDVSAQSGPEDESGNPPRVIRYCIDPERVHLANSVIVDLLTEL